MKNIWIGVAVLGLGTVGTAQAGALYGTVKQAGRPLAGVYIDLGCPTLAAPRARTEGRTDNTGGFSMRVAGNGRCEMRLRSTGVVGAPFPVFVSDNPVRFDFTVNPALGRLP